MSRRLTVVVSLVALSGCAGFKAVDRGDWFRVYADPASRGPTAKQELISRDKYEEEVAAGNRRSYEPLPGWVAPYLAQTDSVTVAVGEVVEYRIDEAKPADVQVNGAAAEIYLTDARKKDAWKDGSDVTLVESSLFIRGVRAGKATLRLSTHDVTKDIPVTVTQ